MKAQGSVLLPDNRQRLPLGQNISLLTPTKVSKIRSPLKRNTESVTQAITCIYMYHKISIDSAGPSGCCSLKVMELAVHPAQLTIASLPDILGLPKTH